jgi:copper transport protein
MSIPLPLRSTRGSVRRGWRALIAALAVLAALIPVGASARPYLVNAEPAAGATLPTAPQEISIFYTEGLDAPYCSISLVDPGGAEHPVHVTVAGTRMVGAPPALGPGTYVVRWTVVGEDGHRVIGDFPFNVQRASANPAIEASAGAGTGYDTVSDVSTVDLVGRSLLGVITVLLAGLLILGFVILPRDPALRPVAGRRLARLRTVLWTLQVAVAAALAAVLVGRYGADALLSSITGKLVLLRLLLTLALAPAVFDGGALRSGRPPGRRAGAYGMAVALMLLGALALSGHALAAGARAVELTVLGVHLLSISLWTGAILAVVAASVGNVDGAPAVLRLRREAGRFTPLVGVSIAVMVVTGLYNARVNLRSLSQLGTSTYGRVLDVKVVLVVLMVAAGLLATLQRTRAASDPEPGPLRRLSRARGAHLAEAGIAVVVLSVAGVLAQTPNPVSFPYPSQVHSQPAGTAFLTASNGKHLIPITVSPGLVGANRVIAGLERTDDNDLPVPVAGVTSLELTASCTCAASPVHATLQPVAGGPWFAENLILAAAGRWTVQVRPQVGGVMEDPGSATADVEPLARADQVLLGVAADLSGAGGEGCQDRAIGLQAAAIEANQGAVAGGDVVRVIALDTREAGGRAVVERLAGMHVALLASPCGDPATVDAVGAAATRLQLPVVGARGLTDPPPWVWSTGLAAEAEGAALADQAGSRKAQSALLLAGATVRDQREAQAAAARLDTLGIPHRQLEVDTDATALAARVRSLNPGTVILVATPPAALPVIQAFSALQPEWSPAKGALACTDLMSNRLVSAAGHWTLTGRISFASEVDPDDAPSLDYATRLQEWYGGRRPAFDGVYGYVAGWIVNNALRNVGADRSPARLRTALDTDFRNFSFGSSYRLSWSGNGRGGADQLAFFTTVYTNPLTLLGGPAATNHAGIFLRSGAYVRLTPYTHVES